jgi:hypothetical protein
LQRKAKSEKLTLSEAGAAIFERAIQQDIDMQYGALLQPIIEQAIRKEMRSMSTHLAFLLVRVAFASEQTRSLLDFCGQLKYRSGNKDYYWNQNLTSASLQ